MDFYNVSHGEKVAEIGAGRGLFSLLIYMSKQSNKIYLNEIGKSNINYLNTTFNFGILSEDGNDSEMIIIKGDSKNTNIPELVDKIIIRKSFHHFTRKSKMLTSIKGNLTEGGKLYIHESVITEDKSPGCKLRMTEQEIKKIVKKSGFTNSRELRLGNILILEYTI